MFQWILLVHWFFVTWVTEARESDTLQLAAACNTRGVPERAPGSTEQGHHTHGVGGRVGQAEGNAQGAAAAEGYREISTTEEFNLLPTTLFQELEWVSHEQESTSRVPRSGHLPWMSFRAAWNTKIVRCGAQPDVQSRNLEF